MLCRASVRRGSFVCSAPGVSQIRCISYTTRFTDDSVAPVFASDLFQPGTLLHCHFSLHRLVRVASRLADACPKTCVRCPPKYRAASFLWAGGGGQEAAPPGPKLLTWRNCKGRARVVSLEATTPAGQPCEHMSSHGPKQRPQPPCPCVLALLPFFSFVAISHSLAGDLIPFLQSPVTCRE